MVNSRQKGKRGESAWRDFLREHGYPDARRGQQFRGGPDSPDVVGGPEWSHAEVKFREQHAPWEHMEQAEREAGGGKIPYVAMKKNNKPWLVVMRAEDWIYLARHAPKTIVPATPTKEQEQAT